MKRLLALLTLALVGILHAEPRQWDTAGVAVRKAIELDWWDRVARADDGSVMLVWKREERSYPQLYGQKLSPDGIRQWESNGQLLARGGAMGVNFPEILFTANSFIAVWMDLDENIYDDGGSLRGRIKAMKYSPDGEPLWTAPALDGVLVNDGNGVAYALGLKISDDGSGGVYVQWSTAGRGYLQHVTASGSTDWAAPLELPTLHNWLEFGLASDGSGNVFVCWSDEYDVYCQKYDNQGAAEWQQPVLLSSTAYNNSVPHALSDGAGGVFVCWQDRLDSDVETLAQRINGDGQVLWPEGGVQVATDDNYLTPRVAQSFAQGGVDGFLVAWENRNSYFRIMGQKLSLNGDLLWPNDELCSPEIQDVYQLGSGLTSDLYGGMLASWIERADGSFDYEAHLARVSPVGEPIWAECSVENAVSQDLRAFASYIGGNNRVNIVWFDNEREDDLMWAKSLNLEDGTLVSVSPLDSVVNRGVSWYQILALSDGRTACVWEDDRHYMGHNLFFKILEVDGSSDEYPSQGSELVAMAGELLSSESASCADGAGGFFCVFESYENGTLSLRITRRTAEGAQVGQTDGNVIRTTGAGQSYFHCVPDGAGGTFVIWSDYDENYLYDVYVQRVNAQCESVWSEPLRILDNTVYGVEARGLVPSINGSCIVFGTTGDWPSQAIRAARVSPAGIPEWEADVSPDSVNWSDVIPDGHGGAVIGWYTQSSANMLEQARIQRLNAESTLLWPTEGVLVEGESTSTSIPKLGIDENGYVYAAYRAHNSSSGSAVHSQKISPLGHLEWSDSGRTVSAYSVTAHEPKIAIVNSENIYVSWPEYFDQSPRQLKITHLSGSGALASDPFWEGDSGAVLCNNLLAQETVQLVPDGIGGVMACWREVAETSTLRSLVAQRIFDPIPEIANETPTVPQELSLSQNCPNPFNPLTNIEFTLPNTGKATLNVFDVTGRLVTTLVDEMMTAGVHQISFNGSNLSSGVYFYSLKVGDNVSTRKMVLLK